MADINSNPTSDNEGGEKPVREKLQKTTIAANGQPTSITSNPMNVEESMSSTHNSSDLRRKRSHEDVDDEEEEEDEDEDTRPSRHGRKRSRDNEAETPELLPADNIAHGKSMNGAARKVGTPPAAEAIISDHLTSPKGKRTRDDFLKEDIDSIPSISNKFTSTAEEASSGSQGDDERGAKRPRDDGEKDGKAAESAKLSTASVFTNTSSTSPFGSLAGSKSPDTKTETSQAAFESSGFSKLAKSSASPFGALGTSSGSASPFGALGSVTKSPPPITGLPKTESAFGAGTATASIFSSMSKPTLGSGFGGLATGTNPFASALSGKGGLSSFGSSGPSGGKPTLKGLSSKPARPFGAPESDEDDEADDNDDDEADDEDTSEAAVVEPESKKDKRFVEQEVETGEEDETTLFSSRAKLYAFEKGEWKERGVGTFKLNISSVGTGDEKRSARLLMRLEGSHRLLLNTAFTKTIKFGDAKGDKPTGKAILFPGSLVGNDKPALLQLRMKAEKIAEVWERADEVKDEL